MKMISKVQVLDEMRDVKKIFKRIEEEEEYACILPYVG